MSIIATCLSWGWWTSINTSRPLKQAWIDQEAYAGRWVAKVRGRIVGQGGTPEQALHAAQMSRHKEKPEISYMSFPFDFHLYWIPFARHCRRSTLPGWRRGARYAD